MRTKTISLFALCVLLGAVMLACGGAADNANTANTATTNANTKTTSTPATTTSTPATTASPATTTTAAGGDVGVAECDDFLKKYETCVSGKVPAAAQATFKTSLETWRSSWKQLASTAQGKAGLAQACKAAADQAKTSLSSYGCAW